MEGPADEDRYTDLNFLTPEEKAQMRANDAYVARYWADVELRDKVKEGGIDELAHSPRTYTIKEFLNFLDDTQPGMWTKVHAFMELYDLYLARREQISIPDDRSGHSPATNASANPCLTRSVVNAIFAKAERNSKR